MVDKYANIMTAEVTMSAANTLTFVEISTGLGIEPDRKSARAMIIDELDYFPAVGVWAQMTTTGDQLHLGITVSNAVDDLTDASDRRILHSMQITRFDAGTAGSGLFHKTPLVYQFFPPLITAERKLYLGMNSVGFAAAQVTRLRAYYRSAEITQADFIELAEVFRLVG